jgi:chemosensory pili system protein ChpA (sensor histidine kinase/response regulator)
VSENFDIGSLTWVKDQINQLLDSVLDNLNTVQGNMDDISALRFSLTHLYQASGALDMVGLEGCKRYCSELEKLAGKLEKKTINATPELIDSFIKAVKTLQNYLQELLNGAPDIPLRLYPTLKPIVDASGESLEESELFFPDTSNSAPKDIPSKQLNDAEYASFIVEQRIGYQKSLLTWLQTKQNDAVQNMTSAVSNVSQAQQKNAPKTLWWAASAFTEALEQKEIAENSGAKRLCRRLDQELRQLAEGVNKPQNSLLRDILYYVAISEIDKASINKVKQVFELDDLIDKKASGNVEAGIIDSNEMVLVAQLVSELETLRELWGDVSNSIDFSQVDVNASHAQVHVDNVLITKFADTLVTSQQLSTGLSQAAVTGLYAALQQASNTLHEDASKVNHAGLIEIAAALNLLETALNYYQQLDSDIVDKLHSEVRRLESISSGEGYDKLESDRVGELDRDTIKAVVTHIKESLKTIEQALDSFFRNPADKASLSLTPPPLRQVSAVFDMLGIATPAAIGVASSQFIKNFQQDDYVPNQTHFELVAESLSMIGLYADEMPKPRAESELALDSALQRLNAALVEVGVADVEVTTEAVSEPSASIVESAETAPAETGVIAAATVTATLAASNEASAKVVATPAAATVLAASADDVMVTDKAYDPELQDIYLTEVEEVLAHIAQNLQALRVNATDNAALVEVRRSYHTLKGSGRTVGLSALGEVAGKVEQFLNEVLDKKTVVNQPQIAAIEQTTAAFAGWAGELQAHNQVTLNQTAWAKRVGGLSLLSETAEAKTGAKSALNVKADAKKAEPQVLIGGTRKMSRAFYEVFINESMQNITALEQDAVKIAENNTKRPSKAAKNAVHTLASNALAAQFISMGELCRAFEGWLDEVPAWTPQHLVLYSNTIKSIAKMWQKISELGNPRSANALVNVLTNATEQARQNKELSVDHSEATETAAIKTTLVPEPIAEPVVEVAAAPVLEVEIPPAPIQEPHAEDGYAEAKSEDFEIKLISEAKQYTQTGGLDTSKVDQELLTMFIEEAREILPEIGAELRAWRTSPKQLEHPDALQRALHTLKGSARMAGQAALGDAVHELEDQVMRSLKRNAPVADFDNMFAELDKIGSFFDETVGRRPDAETTDAQARTSPSGRATDRKGQFLRLRADTLDRLINDAGEISIIRSRMDRELTGFKQSSNDLTESISRLRNYLRELEIEAETQMQSRMSILEEANESFDPLEFDRFTRLQELTRMIAESVNDVGTIQQGLLSSLNQSEAALQQQNRMNRDLQQTLLGVRMLPFKQLSERMQRIVRQTARELNKSVELVIDGEDTEIDRSVLDKLGAPLEHLLRNAVAHGLELPAERKAQGKPVAGTIRLKIRQENDEIHIDVSDDGAGINLQRVKEKAIKNKLLDPKKEVTDQALMSLIFETGFSTADKISQISGRGVGLDVVRNDISGLGGRVDLSSEFGKGTLFSVHLPVTQTVAQVLVVRVGEGEYAIPVGMIEQAQKIKRQDLIKAYEAGEINWAGKKYPIHFLSQLLDHQEHVAEDHAYVSVLLLRSGAYSTAVHVDEVIGNQEAVMKPIGAQLARVPGIVGASVSGDGGIVLIINPVQMANREILAVGSVQVKADKAVIEKALVKQRIMVVDDSLTMRKVLSRSLERAGFEVLVAKDGMDAMQMLQDITPDAILTDIEMPRMDGFGLARNVRDDKRTKNTPLIMISSRTADKHQNLATEIGVDAFFGKPVQDDDLISKVKELLAAKPKKH